MKEKLRAEVEKAEMDNRKLKQKDENKHWKIRKIATHYEKEAFYRLSTRQTSLVVNKAAGILVQGDKTAD